MFNPKKPETIDDNLEQHTLDLKRLNNFVENLKIYIYQEKVNGKFLNKELYKELNCIKTNLEEQIKKKINIEKTKKLKLYLKILLQQYYLIFLKFGMF